MDFLSILEVLKTKTAAVVGCGGLGGFAIEALARAGVGELVLADGDDFCKSNLNRQRFCDKQNIGKNKALEAKAQTESFCDCRIVAISQNISQINLNLLSAADVVLDCVDNIETKLLLQDFCAAKNKYLVHGGINGLQGEVLVVPPDKPLLSKLYIGGCQKTGATVCPSPMLVGAIQANEAIKLLSGEGVPLIGKLLAVDLLTNQISILNL